VRRRRRPAPRPWEHDWRNPDMLVLRTFINGWGRREAEYVTPGESSDLSRDAVEQALVPKYDRDPSYHWARDAKRRRRR
jgi:hypothetical protein